MEQEHVPNRKGCIEVGLNREVHNSDLTASLMLLFLLRLIMEVTGWSHYRDGKTYLFSIRNSKRRVIGVEF